MSDPSASRFAAAAAVRRLVHALVGHDADDPTLDRVAATADELVAELAGLPRRDRRLVLEAALARLAHPERDDRADAFADRAIAGRANPTAVPVEFERDGDDVVTHVVFGPAFEGAPGRVHGGVLAAVFDDLMGVVPASVGATAVTGRLTVHYRKPVPIETPVEFRARLHERDGRKIFVRGDARGAGDLFTEAEALYVSVDFR